MSRARTVDIPFTCLFCQAEDGSTTHLFFECNFAKSVWSTAALSRVIDDSRRNRGEIWFCSLLMENDEGLAELILTICDYIWKQKNKRCFTENRVEAGMLAASAGANLRAYQAANLWPEHFSDKLLERSLLKPPPDNPRILCDGVILNGKAGLGVVLLGQEGDFVFAEVVCGVSDSLFAEARALEKVVTIALDMELNEVSIINDSIDLVQMIRETKEPPIMLQELIQGIKRKMHSLGLAHPF